MVDFTQEDFRYYADRVDQLLHRFTGQTTQRSGGSGAGSVDKEAGLLRQTVKKTTESLKTLHGSASDASYALQKVVGWGALGVAIMAVVGNLTEMSRTFSKLSDLGQEFGGSMFQMQRLAGDSGLTLEQFAQQVTKSSVVIASMSSNQVKGIENFNKYQKGVRDGLKQFGYYGMTLSQLTDVSADYAETLLETGQWEKRSDDQRRLATTDFIKNITGLAAATGKSREALIKQTTEALKSPAIASAMLRMTEEQQKSAQQHISMMYATMGQAGGDAFKELVAVGGQAQFTAAGQANISVGLANVNAVNEKIYREMMQNNGISLDTLQEQKDMADDFDKRDKAGAFEGLYKDPAARPAIDAMRAIAQQWRGKSAQTMQENMEKAQARQMDAATLAVQNFETNLNEFTGSFRKGFYGGIVAAMIDGSGGVKRFNDSLARLNPMIADFGKAAGVIFALFLDVIPTLTFLLTGLTKVLGGVNYFFGLLLTPLEMLVHALGIGAGGAPVYEKNALGEDLKDKAGKRIPVFKKAEGDERKDEEGFAIDASGQRIQETTQSSDVAKPIAAAITLGLATVGGIMLKRWLGRMMKMEAKSVYINTPKLFGPGGNNLLDDLLGGGNQGGGGGGIRNRFRSTMQGFREGHGVLGRLRGGMSGLFRGGAQGSLDLGGGGRGIFSRAGSALGGMVKGGGGLLKMAGKGVIGGLLTMGVDAMLDSVGEFKGKKTLSSIANYAGIGATIGSFFGPIGTLVGGVTGGFIGLIAENFDSITGSIGSMLGGVWNGMKWVASLYVGIWRWLGNKIWEYVPNWLKKWLVGSTGEPKPPADAATGPPPSADVQKSFTEAIPQIADMIKPMVMRDPTLEGNADNLIKSLASVTPAMMAQTMKLVEADPNRTFLTAPIKQDDTFEALNERLLELAALKGLDEEKKKQGDTSNQTLCEIKKTIEEQQQITNILLHRGNNQRDAATRTAANQQALDRDR